MNKFLQLKNVYLVIIILLIISVLLFVPADPDLFWRLKLGEITSRVGPVQYDTLSYTFYGHQLVDFEWAIHWLMYLLYRAGGFYLLSVIFAVIVFVAFYIPTLISKDRKPLHQRLAIIFLSLIATFTIIGIRPQMITVLLFSISYFLIIKFIQTKVLKYLYFIPLVIFIWVNSHPGFLAGFLLLGILLAAGTASNILQFLELDLKDKLIPFKRKDLMPFTLVILLSAAVTIINPYYYHIWGMIIENITDSYSQNTIIEWLAPNFHALSGKVIIIYLISAFVIVFKSKKLNIFGIAVVILFGLMSFTNVRHFPLFVIVTIPYLMEISISPKILSFFKGEAIQHLLVLFFLSTLVVLYARADRFLYVNKNDQRVYQFNNYPFSAVNYLRKNNISGNMFNDYGWGGFLTWEYPENKVFISGLMPSWQKDGERFLKTYRSIHILSIPEWQEKLDKFNVKILILKKDSSLANAAENSESWEKVYEDEISVVYKRSEK